PERFVDARKGRVVLAMLATEVGAPVPTDTYEVATPGGGSHLYFRSPPGLVLRNTVGSLGWKIDSRSVGGYCVAAGSATEHSVYRVMRGGEVAELPAWLARALTPAPPPALAAPMELPARRACGRRRPDGERTAVWRSPSQPTSGWPQPPCGSAPGS
ncbi:MAG: bifunctional DNA primase/polymerase, partial [Actinomycetia bacterium]|nr:bifunctional DNA primase/polymerase [Actinomycetes bacterium]